MQSSRDSSVWRSLAVAFGDGVAFGVGMKLTSAGRSAATTPAAPPEAPPVTDRMDEIDRRLARLEQVKAVPPPALDQQKVLEAVVNAVDAKLRDQAGRFEQRLNEMEATIASELKLLEEQDHAVASFMKDNLEELQEQFAGQIAAVRREIADLTIAGRDRELLDLLNGVGDLVRQAAERISGAGAEEIQVPEASVPSFTQPSRPRGLWRVPLVSSMVIATGAIAMMHYL